MHNRMKSEPKRIAWSMSATGWLQHDGLAWWNCVAFFSPTDALQRWVQLVKQSSYVAGISEQPDQLKLSGQVKRLCKRSTWRTRMLGKRPGCEFREDTGANAHLGHWFVYRDPNEQYIGAVRPTTDTNNRGGQIDVFVLSLHHCVLIITVVPQFNTGICSH